MLKSPTFLAGQFPLETARFDVYPDDLHDFKPATKRYDISKAVARLIAENYQLKREVGKKYEAQENQSGQTHAQLVKQLLPTLDGFERVLHLGRSYPQSEQMENWLKSVESIHVRLLSMLESHGLYQLNAVGSKVDLNLQEVVEYRPSKDHEHEVVIAERQKGYVFRGKLLREAKVVVAYNEGSL